MNTPIPYPILSSNDAPTHVLVPIDVYKRLCRKDTPPEGYVFVPHEVVLKVLEGVSPLRAWRDHLCLTQEDVSRRMGVSRPAYTQMEQSEKPHRATLEKAADALCVPFEQLIELYDDEPTTQPVT